VPNDDGSYLFIFVCVLFKGCCGLLHGKTRVRPIGGRQRGLHAVARSVFAGPLSHRQVVASVRGRRQRQRSRRHTVSTYMMYYLYMTFTFTIINKAYYFVYTYYSFVNSIGTVSITVYDVCLQVIRAAAARKTNSIVKSI